MRIKRLHCLRAVLTVGLVLFLTGCSASDIIEFFHLRSLVTFFTAGPIADYQRNLMLFVFGVMLFVLVPVVGFTFWFAWNYRQSNSNAGFLPNWHHSGLLEGFLWGGPVVIILILGTLTIITTYDMDPYKPIESENEPIKVDAIAMDWKWLFIYPDQEIAVVNEMAMPVDTPVVINLTSASVMAGFMIPRLGSQIMVMSGMGTQLNLMANKKGNFFGRNYQYTGDGFADMHFRAKSMTEKDFNKWIDKAKGADQRLDMSTYDKLVEPSKKVPVTYYSSVRSNLFSLVIESFNSGDGKMSHYQNTSGESPEKRESAVDSN